MSIRFLLVLLSSFAAAGEAGAVGPPPSAPLPYKAVVKGDSIISCFQRVASLPDPFSGLWDAVVFLRIGSVSKDAPPRMVLSMPSTDGLPFRWHVEAKGFWIAASDASGVSIIPSSPRTRGAAEPERFDLGGLFRGKLVAVEGAAELRPDAGPLDITRVAPNTPASDAQYRGVGLVFEYAVFCDYQPIGDFRVRQFVLTDVLKFTKDVTEITEDTNSTPVWSFDIFRYRAKYDRKKGRWVKGEWKLEASLPVTFREPFFALGRGDDWYFLTESGRLFLSPDPGKGKKRKVVPVWEDRDRRILGQVQDAKTGKTFLFVPPAQVGGKPAFFELSGKPKLVEYDPKLVPMPPLAEPHRTILHDARILVALNKIKGKLPAKEGEKKKP